MIPCDQHDYIEIACTYRYPIRLTLKSGIIVEGTALDTAFNSDRAECIKLKVQGAEQLVVLDEIAKLEAKVANPHFQSVTFD